MTGNITEEQFKEFCKDFVENYEGRNFQELIKSLGGDFETVYKGTCNNSLTFIDNYYGLCFGDIKTNKLAFSLYRSNKLVFVNCCVGRRLNCFYTIEDLYKFFKMDLKETEKPSNDSKVTFNIPIEIIKEDYIEFLSKKHNLNKESLELKIVM